MTFPDIRYSAATIALMNAALDTACATALYQYPDLSLDDRHNMEDAILSSIAVGERDFMRLQWHALTVVGAYAVAPTERRQKPRLAAVNDAAVNSIGPPDRTQF
jgi:hypothetical protein